MYEAKSFIDSMKTLIYKILNKENLLAGEWHLGVVKKVNEDCTLDVYIDGSFTATSNVPCNPNYSFLENDSVWVQYINRKSNNLFVPSRRAIGEKRIPSGTGHEHLNKATLDGTQESFTSLLKNKLDGVESGANNYIHPSSHSPSMITQDSSNRFVTDIEKSAWNGKAEGTHNHAIGDVTDLQTNLDGKTNLLTATATFATSTDIWYRIATSPVNITRNSGVFEIEWGASGKHGRVTIVPTCMYGVAGSTSIQQLSGGFYGTGGMYKVRIVYNATYTGNYAYVEICFSGNSSSMMVNVKAIDVLGWTLVTPSTLGEIPSGYVSKELTFAVGMGTTAQLFSNIASGTAPLVVSSNTVVTNLNADKIDGCDVNDSGTSTSDLWTASKITTSLSGKEPTISSKGTAFNKNYGTTATDVKMNGTQAVGSVDAIARIDHVHPTDTSRASTSVATTGANGLMSSTDKTKLDGIEASANNYSHPANHPPSVITQDSSNRFVTDTEKSTWNGKADGSHNHDTVYEAKNANIQTHVTSAHAPSTAQKNSDITKAEIEAKLTGSLTTHNHTGLKSIDDRDRKPADTTKAYLELDFNSLGGMTGTSDSNYQDVLVLNSYADATGGSVNALAIDKSEMVIRHFQALQTDTTWGTPEQLAYITESITDSDVKHSPSANAVYDALALKSNTSHTHDYEPVFSKNTAFNKNFGSTVGTVCEGNDSRLSDSRTPTTHTHAYLELIGGALTGKLNLPASTVTEAPLSVPHGTAPTTPVNGDIWTTTTGMLVRLNGTTRTLVHTATWASVTQAAAEAGTSTTTCLWTPQRVGQAVAALQAVKSVNSKTGIVSLTASDVGAVANGGNTPSILSESTVNKPSAGTVGRLFVDTTLDKIYRDNGTEWKLLNDSSTFIDSYQNDKINLRRRSMMGLRF